MLRDIKKNSSAAYCALQASVLYTAFFSPMTVIANTKLAIAINWTGILNILYGPCLFYMPLTIHNGLCLDFISLRWAIMLVQL